VRPTEDIIASIRKRAAMYIGDTGEAGLRHLLWEVVGNAVDEHLAGFGDRITITLGEQGRVTVEDEGRGLSVDPLEDGTPLLVHVLTHMHDRATFDGHPRHVHLGARGVGLVAVSALSRHLVVETTRDGRRYRLETVRGAAKALEDLGPTDEQGTRLMFLPDAEIFDPLELDATAIRGRLFEIAAFCPALCFRVVDERRGEIACPAGLLGLLARQHPRLAAALTAPISASEEREGIRVDVVLTWSSTRWGAGVRSYLNHQETRDGGTHVEGLQRGIRALVPRDTPERQRVVRTLRERLVAIVSVLHHDPQLGSPTRSKLVSPEVRPVVEAVVKRAVLDRAKLFPGDVRELLVSCGRGDG
jgi:DNA gyrase subunit B